MELAAQGKVDLRAKTYGLDQINEAIDDFMAAFESAARRLQPDRSSAETRRD